MKYDFSKLDKDTTAKVLCCETVDELKEYVKTNNIDVPEDKVAELYESIKGSMQLLSDEALAKVAGGMVSNQYIEYLKEEMRKGNRRAAMDLYLFDVEAYYAISSELRRR